MKVTITDPYLGKRSFDGDDDRAMVADQLKLLREFERKKTSQNPKALADDIRCYEILLEEPLAAEKCREYMNRRLDCKFKKDKVEILTEMGLWPEAKV